MAAFEQRSQAQTGSHIMINPFGMARLYYMDKEMASNEHPTTHPIGTLDFKFLVRVNRNGTFDIQRKNDVAVNVTIETTAKVCQIQVRTDEFVVPPWYRAKRDTLSQVFSTRQTPDFAESHFRIKLMNSALFRRVDVRYLNHSWFTIMISNNQLMKMCVNATRELELMQWACADLINQVKNGTPEVSVKQLGLSADRVTKRTDDDQRSVCSVASARSQSSSHAHTSHFAPSTSQVNKAPRSEYEGMPSLVLSNQVDKIREKYIKQLELALAAVKSPAKNHNNNFV